jgi:hypothetical protein
MRWPQVRRQRCRRPRASRRTPLESRHPRGRSGCNRAIGRTRSGQLCEGRVERRDSIHVGSGHARRESLPAKLRLVSRDESSRYLGPRARRKNERNSAAVAGRSLRVRIATDAANGARQSFEGPVREHPRLYRAEERSSSGFATTDAIRRNHRFRDHRSASLNIRCGVDP